MKTLSATLGLLLAAPVAALAQQPAPATPPLKTLVGPSSHIGFFAATTAQYTRLRHEDALALTGRLGVTFNRTLSLGLGGTALANGPAPRRWYDPQGTSPNYLAAAYGGVYVEPLVPAGSVVHLAFPVLIGGGAATIDDDFSGPYRDYRADGFFIVEPGLTVEVNVAKFLVLGVGATYRHTAGLDLPATSRTALNGLAGGLTLKIGRL